jgi:hypothetical protein
VKFFPVLVLGAIAIFAFKDEISLYAGKVKQVAAASSSVSNRGAELSLERLGGERTSADLHWISAMNSLCARRNSEERALVGVGYSTRSLARYAARTLVIWDRYARRAAALPVPQSYAKEAGWLRVADDARRRGIEAVLVAARAGKVAAAGAAIDAFGNSSERMRPNLIRIGLDNCADFDP